MTEPLGPLLVALGWSNCHLGAQLGVAENRVRRWRGGAPIPPEVVPWLEALIAAHDALPPPALTKGPKP